MLGLDVYNGSAQQVEGFKRVTNVSFPLLLRASNGTNYGAGREYLMVIDREGVVRMSLNGASSNNRQRVIDLVETLLAAVVYPEFAVVGSGAFGAVTFEETVSQTVTVQNNGSVTLSVSEIGSSSELVSVEPKMFDVAPGASREVTVTLVAGVKGDVSAQLTVMSNAKDAQVIDVMAQVPNAVPVAVNDTVRLAPNERVNVPVLNNDVDLDGDVLTIAEVMQGKNSERVVVNSDQTVHYRPVMDFVGEDTFTYTLDDGWGGVATGTVVVIFEAPVVEEPVVETPVTPVSGTGDFDGDGRVGFADFVLFAQGFGGTDARFDLNGDGVVSFPDFLIFGRLFQSGG